MSIAQVQRYLDTAVKAASVAITVPATWAVAGVAFGLMDVVLVRRVLQLAAVVVVDCACRNTPAPDENMSISQIEVSPNRRKPRLILRWLGGWR